MSDIRAGDLIALKGDFVPLTHRGHYFLVLNVENDEAAQWTYFHVFDHLLGCEKWYTHQEVEAVKESSSESR